MESPFPDFDIKFNDVDRFDTCDDELLQSVNVMEKLGCHGLEDIHIKKPPEQTKSRLFS